MKACHSLIEGLIALLIIWAIVDMLKILSFYQNLEETTYLFETISEECSITCWLNVDLR